MSINGNFSHLQIYQTLQKNNQKQLLSIHNSIPNSIKPNSADLVEMKKQYRFHSGYFDLSQQSVQLMISNKFEQYLNVQKNKKYSIGLSFNFLRSNIFKSITLINTFRFLYFLILLYVGSVFPILISMGWYNMIVEIVCDFMTLLYIILKIRAYKMGFNQSLFKYVAIQFDVIELISLIPLEILNPLFIEYLYFLKIFRLKALKKQFRKFLKNVFLEIEDKTIDFLHTILEMEIAIIWMSNFWIFYSDFNDPKSWRNLYCDDPSACFLKSYYFIFYTCYTVGYGEIPAITIRQKAILIIIMIFGVILFSYLIAAISNYFSQQILSSRELKQQVLIQIGQHFESHAEGEKVIQRLRKYLKRQHKLDFENEQNFFLINYMPQNLKHLISQKYNVNELGNIKFFKRFFDQSKFLHLMKHMKSLIFKKGQIIVEEGYLSQCLYFIKHGKAGALVSHKYLLKNQVIFAIFHESSSFGEYEVFPTSRNRDFSIIALEDCQVYLISAYQLIPYLQKDQGKLYQYIDYKYKILLDIEKKVVEQYLELYKTQEKANTLTHFRLFTEPFNDNPVNHHLQSTPSSHKLKHLKRFHELSTNLKNCINQLQTDLQKQLIFIDIQQMQQMELNSNTLRSQILE